MAISFSLAEVVGLATEAFMFGIFFILLIQSLILLYRRRKSLKSFLPVTSLAVLLAILITWHILIDAVRLVFAFKSSQIAEGADLFYANAASTLSVMKTAVYLVITVAFDAFMLYRCFIAWNYNIAVVILTTVVYLADIGTGIASTHGLASLKSADTVFVVQLGRITKSFFSTTLAVNGICTLLIAYRVWERQRFGRDARVAFNLTRDLIIIAESGMLYTTNLVVVVSLYAAQSNVFNVFLDMASPIIGVAFCLIVLRTTKAMEEGPTHISMKNMNEEPFQDSVGNDALGSKARSSENIA
ncbi:hypothetical protein BC629DRAFT_1514830 [Irpex lacteus]|nr:hypothetical protein BC629DRAFT_1514830 [Irpex lacteus]